MASDPKAAERRRRSQENAKTDDAFYARASAANGGKLPANLIGPDGKPRKLTTSPEDSAYRRMWREERNKLNSAKASNKAAGSPIQGCAKQATKKQADPRSRCRHGELVVKAGRRSVRIADPAAPAPVTPASEILEVVAGPDAAGAKAVEATLQLHQGPCASHDGRTLSANPMPYQPGGRTSTKLDFKVACQPLVGGLADFLPLDPDVGEFTVSGCSCGASGVRARLRVFPELSWKGELGWRFQNDWKEAAAAAAKAGGSGNESFLRRLIGAARSDSGEGDLVLAVSWSLERKLGTQSQEWGREISGTSAGCRRLTKFVGHLAEFLFHSVCSLTGTEVEINTGGKLGFEWGWEEDSGPTCHLSAKAKIKASPLLGIKVSQDVTDALLALLVVVSNFTLAGVVDRIQKLRAAAAKGIGKEDGSGARAKGAITLKCEGELSVEGEVSGTWRNGQWQAGENGTKCSTACRVSGKLALELEGELSGSAQAQAWYTVLSIEAGVTASARSELEISEPTLGFTSQGLLFGVKVVSSGLVLKKAWLVKGGVRYGEKESGPKLEVAESAKAASGERAVAADGTEYEREKRAGESEAKHSIDQSGISSSGKRSGSSEHVLVPPRTWDFTKDRLLVFKA